MTDIGTNTSGIATNVTDIATNTSGIATNVTDIATNTHQWILQPTPLELQPM